MPDRPPINQLDPFGEIENEYRTREIRRSRSRSSRNFFINLVNNEDEKIRKHNRLLLLGGLIVIILIILAIIFIPKLSTPAPTPEPEPLVNPTGREAASSKDAPSFDDPEARAYEQEKLNTVLALLNQDDWEYTNALFETIFPNYLDACGKYDYYRAATVLSENFEGFSISHDVATARAEELCKNCHRDAEQPSQESVSD